MTATAPASSVMELLPGPGEWQEADYFPLSEKGRLAELSDGNIEVPDLPTYIHQWILMRLAFALHGFVQASGLGEVCLAPLPVRLWPGKIREPDIVFMRRANAHRMGQFWGVPDLAVEILSESTALKDRTTKSAEYAMAGVAEYWIVDSEFKCVESLTGPTAAGCWMSRRIFHEQDVLCSHLFPGFELPLGEIFSYPKA